ncbi:MAG: hypothetical protein A3C79_02115 [Candidatus Taylorbacteria bacterium RIFCSPHIGHO2_02_FULL_45_28]|uniref:Uncharacterized protein n=1 Tax=Candidatus Taylorbacteria bacterium RIFCSPHIGHO2_12_FULL_45_16 TaxID=1802315 RepID=A0A1G2N279_9BACT|nr:MAG: hypothetical protein A2830_02920 [Candidatus Taylorbacteria bacterium RIFCSPHIGHO2_01_FULL_44_110]OHA25246.1 MAG: hypothetical protein A3C79_02115 [Candidatus Taylorbacteria bacterium RIFCSPHIGHO2_02_FULL_45_28]OHA29489.1 MAG: hypothetical protein A3F51_00425 [Candidatus Taylorbacteria bacterium RIFCSPHIGHO2_12_FULL_45_16]OHA33251.1 MAG: hypothetical protein A3A23_02955 [Candidatus Taylorbacteria bacterium RIFCSPLOWO2_01_FULL_45_59]OHA38300.1 MAG: hypothetical protein A3I98_03220 [Candi
MIPVRESERPVRAGEIVMIELENMRSLRKLLTEKRPGEDRRARILRTELFDQITTQEPSDKNIKISVKWSFCGIAANGLGSDAHLVAAITKAWNVAYPGNSLAILVAIATEANSHISDAGEGLTIGLLEMVNERIDHAFESRVLSYLGSGCIAASLATSFPTSAGSGRLTTAIQSLTTGMWIKGSLESSLRQNEVLSLLSNMREVLLKMAALSRWSDQESGTLDYFWNFSPQGKQSFLEKFADELSKRFFSNSPLGLRFYLNKLLEGHPPVESSK